MDSVCIYICVCAGSFSGSAGQLMSRDGGHVVATVSVQVVNVVNGADVFSVFEKLGPVPRTTQRV